MTRRKTLQALGATGLTSLAGCASMLEEEEPETITENHSENPGNNTENNTEDRPEETEEPRETGEEASTGYTWQDILDAEQQFYEKNVDPIYRNTARSLSNGNVPDTEYSPEDFEFSSVIGYTDNSGEFSIERFKQENYEDALQDLSTFMFLKAVERNNGNPGISGMTRLIGLASERIFEDLRDQEVTYSFVANDSHGFWPLVLSPRRDPYTVDVNSNYHGKTWEDPMSQRSGISPITNFDESMIPEQTLNSRELVSEYQTMLKRLSDQPSQSNFDTGVNPELMPEINEELSTPGSMHDTLVPAIAVLNYQHQRNPDQGYILNPDSITDLPEFRPGEDDFQKYSKQIEENIESYTDMDKFRDIRQGLKQV